MTRLDDKGDKDDKDKSEGLRIQEKMLEARTILVTDEVSDEMYRKVASSLILLEQLDKPERPVTVFVNSPGGSADSGFAIYDLLRFSSCPVRSVANGVVASAAVLIYLGAPKGQRYCLPNARFLLHQPSTIIRGRSIEIDIAAKEIIKLRRRYNEIVAETTGRTVEEVDKDSDRDFWLSAAEAKDYGLVDHIVRNRAELESRTA
ncbi:MAG TPA: ATP-dependent Clp protease proteolytic subunit [Enhygromyxa sp.]|nr:ATP-dependent Clp protease proteolytic subunit [Enhygromyxa sp.]